MFETVEEIGRRISKDLVGREFHELDSIEDGKLIMQVMARAAEMRFEVMRSAPPPARERRLFKVKDYSAPSREPGEDE